MADAPRKPSRATLAEWLEWMESSHPQGIELGLERVARVHERLGLDFTETPVITVAGTNGKGSCAALMTAALQASGRRVGLYSSPHILRYNERVCIAGEQVSDAALCGAFETVYTALEGVSLTYFEFGTLAALQLFHEAAVDALVLEVGLGGRLDAVNLLDADVAVVSSVDLDHQQWLGDDRESIGYEKAGVFRPGRPVVCGDPSPPRRLLEHAATLACPLLLRGRDFDGETETAGGWRFRGFDRTGRSVCLEGLPLPRLALQNAAVALQALLSLGMELPATAMAEGMAHAVLPGRLQREQAGGVEVVLDVAHNPAAAGHLARALSALPPAGRTVAVFAALADKDIDGIVAALQQSVERWFLGELGDNPRALPAREIAAAIHREGTAEVDVSENLMQAYRRALSALAPGDRLVVFGSFFTVAEIAAIMARDRQDMRGIPTS